MCRAHGTPGMLGLTGNRWNLKAAGVTVGVGVSDARGRGVGLLPSVSGEGGGEERHSVMTSSQFPVLYIAALCRPMSV